jgi:hypothetical protein
MNKTANYFNLNEFKNGKKATTKLGNPVKFITMAGDKVLVKVYHRSRIVGFSEKSIAPMLEGTVEKYNLNGRKYNGTETMYDLVMEAPTNYRPRDAKGRFIKA